MLHTKDVEKIKTRYIHDSFFLNIAPFDIMWKNTVLYSQAGHI
jgi:hypothetical protein